MRGGCGGDGEEEERGEENFGGGKYRENHKCTKNGGIARRVSERERMLTTEPRGEQQEKSKDTPNK